MLKTYRVLTLYLVKDKESFIYENYISVINQRNVEQKVYVVSAKPINVEKNIVVPVSQNFPLPIRVSLSINVALRKIGNIDKYTHLFKVDGDVKLPPDYLENLLTKKTPVAGRGAALLISMKFITKFMNGRYPISHCDDGYILALSTSLGYWPPEYDGMKPIEIPSHKRIPSREYLYGREYFKWGMPFKVLIIISVIRILKNKNLKLMKENFKAFLFNLAGYISAIINNEKRYQWWDSYSIMRSYHLASRILTLINRK